MGWFGFYVCKSKMGRFYFKRYLGTFDQVSCIVLCQSKNGWVQRTVGLSSSADFVGHRRPVSKPLFEQVSFVPWDLFLIVTGSSLMASDPTNVSMFQEGVSRSYWECDWSQHPIDNELWHHTCIKRKEPLFLLEYFSHSWNLKHGGWHTNLYHLYTGSRWHSKY